MHGFKVGYSHPDYPNLMNKLFAEFLAEFLLNRWESLGVRSPKTAQAE